MALSKCGCRKKKAAVADSVPPSAALEEIRRRGYSVGLRNDAQRALSERLQAAAQGQSHHPDVEDLLGALAYDPVELTPALRRDIRVISAPVFGTDGEIALALTLYDFPKPDAESGIGRYIDDVLATAEAATRALARPLAAS